MATNGDLPSDDDSIPGSPSVEDADGATQEIEEEDQEAAKPKSALKKTTKTEIITQPAIKPELPQQRDPNTFDVTELTPLSPEVKSILYPMLPNILTSPALDHQPSSDYQHWDDRACRSRQINCC